MTEMKVGMCCKERGYGVPVRNTHVVTAGVFKTKLKLKEKECSSRLMELNIVCCWNRRGEESMAMRKIHMMVMMEHAPYLKNCVEQ